MNNSSSNTHMRSDMDLLVVTAVSGYARKHRMSTHDAVKVFSSNDIFSLIRSQYDVLHTLALDESVQFAEDVLARRGVKQ